MLDYDSVPTMLNVLSYVLIETPLVSLFGSLARLGLLSQIFHHISSLICPST